MKKKGTQSVEAFTEGSVALSLQVEPVTEGSVALPLQVERVTAPLGDTFTNIGSRYRRLQQAVVPIGNNADS
jgi:hypothetical protein